MGEFGQETEVDEYLHEVESVDAAKTTVLLQLRFHKLAGSKAPKQFYFQAETRAGRTHNIFDIETPCPTPEENNYNGCSYRWFTWFRL